MIRSIRDGVKLANGVSMPWLGLGVWQVPDGKTTIASVDAALRAGYRSIDTAAAYRNEQGVGKAVAGSGLPREEIFVTTKVWNSSQGYDSTLAAFEESRQRLGLATVDLYLVHWPVKGKFRETWRAMEELYAAGKVRAIGVSNFQIHHLEELMESCTVRPMVNQVELHPHLTQKRLLAFCAERRIQLEAWSPLMQGRLEQPELRAVAGRLHRTPAQIVLRWGLQNGVVVIPKSVHESRIMENAGIFDFELASQDMAAIDAMNRDHRYGPDPDNFNF